jgi:1-acyl-sn-glycerol-3-phosphate acyltransferase
LKNGEKLCIFPEGTRNKTDEEMLPFHHGAAAIAIKCKAPIVPMVIYKKPRYFRMTHILVGEPIEFTEYYGKKLTEEELTAVDNSLRQRMIKMRREHTEFLQSKKKKKTK